MSPVRFVHLGGDLLIAPWRQEWQPTPVFLPGEFHGQRRLAGYSPWGRKESGMTGQLALPLSFREASNVM